MSTPILPPPSLRFMAEADADFLPICDHLAANVLARTGGRRDLDVLDVGCGYGRLAYGLRRAGLTGTYRGFDVLTDHIGWLRQHFATPDDGKRFGFDALNVHNARYNPSGQPFEQVELPYADRSADCITTFSVFTHMYEDDIAQYLRRIGPVLRDDGIWIATFFCLPDDFSLDQQSPLMRYRLTHQISADAFIHDVAEPLYVIAYRESLLRALIEKAGLQIVAHQRGAWLGDPADGEFQDWLVLRKAAVVAEVAANMTADIAADGSAGRQPAAQRTKAACTICGGEEFGPGPGGRMAATSIPPCCRSCESLERQRIARQLLQALPIGFLDWRRCLQFSPDPAPNPAWFRSHELSVYGGQNSLDVQAIDRADGSYDFVTLSHVLECIPRDRAAFDELVRVLTPRGILHLGLAGALSRARTQDFEQAIDRYGTVHLYGRDVYQHFDCAAKGLAMLVAEGVDPVTGVRDTIHLFARHAPDVAAMRTWLTAWRDTVTIVEERLP